MPSTKKRKRTARSPTVSKRAKRVLNFLGKVARRKKKPTKRGVKIPKKLRKQITDVVHHSDKHDVYWYVKSQELEQYNGNGGLIPIQSYVYNPQYTMDVRRILLPNIIQNTHPDSPYLCDERFTRTGAKLYTKSLTMSGMLDLSDPRDTAQQFNFHNTVDTTPITTGVGILDRMSVTVKIVVFDWAKTKLPGNQSTGDPESALRWETIVDYDNGQDPNTAKFDQIEWSPQKNFDGDLGKMDPGNHFKILAKKTLKWKMGSNLNAGFGLPIDAKGNANMHLARLSRKRFRINIPCPKVLNYPETTDQQPANFAPMAFAYMTYDNGAPSPSVAGNWLKLKDIKMRFKFSP
ncbi:hypothetical protein ES705_34799 [subsurface metagenome]